jgi:WD40 repeat protein
MISKLDAFPEKVMSTDFGPEETTAVVGFSDGSLILLDLDTGETIAQYEGHESAIWTLDVSPDGQFLISGDDDGLLILWDIATGEELYRFDGHTKSVQDVSFNPDGKTAFSAGKDGELIQWRIVDLPIDNLIEWIKANRYIRDFTCEEREQYQVEPLCRE